MHTVRELPVAAVWLLTQGFSVCFFGPKNEIFSLFLFLKQKPVSQLLHMSKIKSCFREVGPSALRPLLLTCSTRKKDPS